LAGKEELICVKCGEKNPPTANYCMICARSFRRKGVGVFKGSSHLVYPIMYLDYSNGFDDCDKFNEEYSRYKWPWRVAESREEKESDRDVNFGGYILKVNEFYFTCALLNSWALFCENSIGDESFLTYCEKLAAEIVEWVDDTITLEKNSKKRKREKEAKQKQKKFKKE
jgi:hypothetical protein